MERAKSVQKSEVYSGQNQRALTDFFKQVDMVFKIKPFTYWLEVNKCIYAASWLAEILFQQWIEEKRRINENLTRFFSYHDFKDFLQEKQLPKHVQFANLIIKIRTLHQKSSQLVLELIAYFNNLEY